MQSLGVTLSHRRLSFGSALMLVWTAGRHLLAQSPVLAVLIQKGRSTQAMDPFYLCPISNHFHLVSWKQSEASRNVVLAPSSAEIQK